MDGMQLPSPGARLAAGRAEVGAAGCQKRFALPRRGSIPHFAAPLSPRTAPGQAASALTRVHTCTGCVSAPGGCPCCCLSLSPSPQVSPQWQHLSSPTLTPRAPNPRCAHADTSCSHQPAPPSAHPRRLSTAPPAPRPLATAPSPVSPGRRGSPRHNCRPCHGPAGTKAPSYVPQQVNPPRGPRSCCAELSPPGSRSAGMFLPSTSLPPSLRTQPPSAAEKKGGSRWILMSSPEASLCTPPPSHFFFFPRPGTDALKHNPGKKPQGIFFSPPRSPTTRPVPFPSRLPQLFFALLPMPKTQPGSCAFTRSCSCRFSL